MEVELTVQRRALLAEAGYFVEPEAPSVPGRVRVGDREHAPLDLTVVPLDGTVRDALTTHVEAWSGVNIPGIEPLVDGLDLGDVAGFLSPASGGLTLSAYVSAHGRLDVGQASTVLVTLGRTLARAHADGLFYGEMTADRVLVLAGLPVLAVALPAVPAPPLPPSPQEDAYHLAALLRSVIAPATGPDAPPGRSPALRELNRLITSALGDRSTRPGVGTLAASSHELAPCVPLLSPPERGSSTDEGATSAEDEGPLSRARGLAVSAVVRPRRRRARVLLVAVTTAVGLTAAGGLVGAALRSSSAPEAFETSGSPADGSSTAGPEAGPDGQRAGPSPTAGGSATDTSPEGGGVLSVDAETAPAPGLLDSAGRGPQQAAEHLTARRLALVAELANDGMAAQASGDTVADPADALTEVLVADSPAHAQAADLVDRLVAQGGVIAGLQATVEEAGVVSAVLPLAGGAATAEVDVTFTVREYTITDAAGPRQIPAAAAQSVVLVLVLEPDGWKVSEVRQSAAEPPSEPQH